MYLTDIIAKLTGEKIMPLKKGYSKKSVSYNIKREMKSGKSRKAMLLQFHYQLQEKLKEKKK
jgi:hypothetical protein